MTGLGFEKSKRDPRMSWLAVRATKTIVIFDRFCISFIHSVELSLSEVLEIETFVEILVQELLHSWRQSWLRAICDIS